MSCFCLQVKYPSFEDHLAFEHKNTFCNSLYCHPTQPCLLNTLVSLGENWCIEANFRSDILPRFFHCPEGIPPYQSHFTTMHAHISTTHTNQSLQFSISHHTNQLCSLSSRLHLSFPRAAPYHSPYIYLGNPHDESSELQLLLCYHRIHVYTQMHKCAWL